MPRKKTTKKENPVEEAKKELAVKEEECQPEKPKALAEAYSVYNNLNQFVRRYTPENHGDRRLDLAKEFAAKIGGTVKEE